MFDVAIRAGYRIVAIALIRQDHSITSTISEEVKCTMGTETSAATKAGTKVAGADARKLQNR
jgi:hypothetical protein